MQLREMLFAELERQLAEYLAVKAQTVDDLGEQGVSEQRIRALQELLHLYGVEDTDYVESALR